MPRNESDVGHELEQLWRSARARWPTVDLDRKRFAAFLNERRLIGERAEARAADLYLTCACAAGIPEALVAFDELLVAVGNELRSVARSDDLLAEALQVTRHLLVRRQDRAPAISDYAGRGDLGGWLRVTLGREIVRLRRRQERDVRLDTDQLERVAGERQDPETAYFRDHYRRELKQAFAAATEQLDGTEVRILRYSVIDGLGIDEIAKRERFHRATAARRLARARQRLIDETRRIIRERLRLDSVQLDSVLQLIDSQVDVSVQRLLREGRTR